MGFPASSIVSGLAVYLLGLIGRVVTNRSVDLFNKLSPCPIQYSANWFPRKCAVILSVVTRITCSLYCFSIETFAFSRFKSRIVIRHIVLSKKCTIMKLSKGAGSCSAPFFDSLSLKGPSVNFVPTPTLCVYLFKHCERLLS